MTPGNPGIPRSTGTPPEELDPDLYLIGREAPLVDTQRRRDAAEPSRPRRVDGVAALGAAPDRLLETACR